MRQLKKYITGILSVILLVGLDQFTKYLAIIHLKDSDGTDILPGIFRLEYLENHGAAFGILQEQRIPLLIITVLIFLILAGIYYKLPRQSRYLPMQIVLILLFSGAVGNMMDRIMHSYVVDFLYFNLINFPIFNVADCYVVIGVIIAILLTFFFYQEEDFRFPEKQHIQGGIEESREVDREIGNRADGNPNEAER